jgi:putative ABC transport system permease protein
LLGIGVGLAVVTVASFSPALRVSRLNPIEMIQGVEVTADTVGWRVVVFGVGLIALATIGLTQPAQGGLARFLHAALLFPLLAGLVLASRAVVPPLSAALGAPFRGLGGGAGRLASLNLTRHVGRTALTVGGFMVSLSLLVAVTSLALSSARAGERLVASLIPSEFVVVSPVEQPALFVDEFARLPDVTYASPVGFFAVQSGRTIVQAASVDPAVLGPRLQSIDGLSPDAVFAFQAGGAVLVPRRLAEARGLAVGTSLELQTADGPRPFRIAGVVEHSFPSADRTSTLLLSRADAERFFGQRGFRLLMVEPRANADPSIARAEVAELAEQYGMSAVTAGEITAEVAAAVFRLLALLAALVGVGTIVGAFGAANTMLMNVAERRREYGVLWAAGMSRRQLQVMTLLEAAMMGLLGGVLGTIVGGVVSVVLVGLSRTSGFEPQYVFPLQAALLGIVLATLAAATAAVVPARQAAMIEGR